MDIMKPFFISGQDSGLRDVPYTRNPFAARYAAVHLPMPEDAPVINTILDAACLGFIVFAFNG
jgi:hypothetical protein